MIPAEEVVRVIDANTDKLKKTAPKFYPITGRASKYELGRMQNTSEDLKTLYPGADAGLYLLFEPEDWWQAGQYK